MRQSIAKFLEFKGKNLLFSSKNGEIYIAIKPVCEALNVNFNRQYQNLQDNPLLKDEHAIQQIHVPGDRLRNFVCLPEKWIYGWIFSIRSDSEGLLEYQRECYNILFDHFNGAMTNRKGLIKEKARLRRERHELQQTLDQDHNFRRYQELIAEEARLGISMKKIDNDELHQVEDLFSSSGVTIN